MAEIAAKYPNEWVVLDRPKVGRFQRVLGGHVVFHSEDRDALDQATYRLDSSLGRHIAILHTSVREWNVGSTRWEIAGTIFWRLLLIGFLVGAGWFAAVLLRPAPPTAVTGFDRIHAEIDRHAAQIRNGSLSSDTDPNGIKSYPLPDVLLQAGVAACLERDGALWYVLPSHPLDGGTGYYVTPVSFSDSVTQMPRRWHGSTYHFQLLRGNWAYWFKG
jgi:hypothetical protein